MARATPRPWSEEDLAALDRYLTEHPHYKVTEMAAIFGRTPMALTQKIKTLYGLRQRPCEVCGAPLASPTSRGGRPPRKCEACMEKASSEYEQAMHRPCAGGCETVVRAPTQRCASCQVKRHAVTSAEWYERAKKIPGFQEHRVLNTTRWRRVHGRAR